MSPLHAPTERTGGRTSRPLARRTAALVMGLTTTTERNRLRVPLVQRRWVQHVATALIAYVVSRRVGLVSGVPPVAVVAVPVIVVALYFFFKDPKWPLMALVATTCFGLYRYSYRLGPANVRVTDIPFLFLVPWALLLRTRQRNWSRNVLGQQYVGFFIAALAFTLLFALVRDSADAARLIMGWLRLLSTLSLLWIVPLIVARTSDIVILFRAISVAISAELVWAILRVPSFSVDVRLTGSNGPNAEGLLAIILLMIAIYSPVTRQSWVKVGMLLLGATSLYLARSVGSLTALFLVLGIFGMKRRLKGDAVRQGGLLRPARFLLLALGLVGVVSQLRPLDLPTSEHFKSSSAGSRLLLGIAGTKIFLDNPVFGVGWQRSSRPEIIAARDLVEELKKEFPDFRDEYYPEVGVTAVTVHNTYIQILAEAGLIGATAFGIAAIVVGRRVRRAVRGLRGTARVAARTAAICLVACLVWLNDNPLFGAQPETVVLAMMLGMLASLAALERREAATSKDGRSSPNVAVQNGTEPPEVFVTAIVSG